MAIIFEKGNKVIYSIFFYSVLMWIRVDREMERRGKDGSFLRGFFLLTAGKDVCEGKEESEAYGRTDEGCSSLEGGKGHSKWKGKKEGGKEGRKEGEG